MATLNSRLATIAAVIGVSLGLSACTTTEQEYNMSPDFGQAVRQDLAAQIADPDAKYKGTPAPGSNGARVELAQKRYSKGQVIQPTSVTASSDQSTAGNADNGAPPSVDNGSMGR
jgi:hypothetical protein